MLLERALEAGVRTLETHSTLLVLPRPNEALAVKDESGIRVDTVEEGYELKGEQVAMAFQPLRLNNYAVAFFNAYQDDAASLRSFLIDRVDDVRKAFRFRLREITDKARVLLQNHEQEQVQEVIRLAASMLRTSSTQHSGPKKINAHVQESLMGELAKAYSITIRASIRREGERANLSYSHHLGYGARRIAAQSLSRAVEGFSELCKTMAANPEFTEAQDLISQADRVLVAAYEEILRKVQLMGQTSFRDELKIDASFWSRCQSEWGRGPGYPDRVTDHNEAWFSEKERQELEKELWSLIEREWKAALANLTSLFDPDQQDNPHETSTLNLGDIEQIVT